jgi:hypothetical protein
MLSIIKSNCTIGKYKIIVKLSIKYNLLESFCCPIFIYHLLILTTLSAMSFTVYNMFKAAVLIANAFAILHPQRFLAQCMSSFFASLVVFLLYAHCVL